MVSRTSAPAAASFSNGVSAVAEAPNSIFSVLDVSAFADFSDTLLAAFVRGFSELFAAEDEVVLAAELVAAEVVVVSDVVFDVVVIVVVVAALLAAVVFLLVDTSFEEFAEPQPVAVRHINALITDNLINDFFIIYTPFVLFSEMILSFP